MRIAPVTSATSARMVAAARKRPRAAEHAYRIEGEYLCVRDIAERLGASKSAVQKRLAALRRASGAITWSRLRGDSP